MGSALVVMLKDDLKREEINDIITSIQHLSGGVSVEEEEDDENKSVLLLHYLLSLLLKPESKKQG